MRFDTITLERLQVAAQASLPREQLYGLADVKLDITYETMIHHLVMSLRAFVTKQNITAQAYTYPATWWDAVKDRWFPAWLLKRFPVDTITVQYKPCYLYPEFVLPPERFGRAVLHVPAPTVYDTRTDYEAR